MRLVKRTKAKAQALADGVESVVKVLDWNDRHDALAGAALVTGVGSKVAGAAWSVAMRGSALLALAAGDVASFAGGTGFVAGAAPKTG